MPALAIMLDGELFTLERQDSGQDFREWVGLESFPNQELAMGALHAMQAAKAERSYRIRHTRFYYTESVNPYGKVA